MSIEQIAVIGAGTMGNGIAQVCAVAGYQVLLVDVSDAALERGVATLSKNLERQVAKGTLDADKAAAARTRIRTSTDYTQLSSAQMVIEAATENLQLKQRILQQVAANVAADCLIATGIPFMGHGNMAEWTRIFGAVAPSVAGLRRFGAASLDLAHVASGRYDGFWESGLQPWDVAAGILMVREAGGFVSDFRGGDQMIDRKEVIAGNDATHSKLHKLVAGALR